MTQEKYHSTKGTHISLDMWNIRAEIYFPSFREKFLQLIRDSGMTVLKDDVYHWPNLAFTMTVILEESSCDVHYWTAEKYISFNIYTCGDTDPMQIAKALGEWLRPEYEQINSQVRGVRP